MDLKSKGMAWAGNFYQKFETMCHEVDNVMKKDTFKFVENRVHTVGENMKKIYSDVVQDLIPPLADPTKHGVPNLKGNATIGTHIQSMIGIEENHGHNYRTKKSPVEHCDFDLVPNQLGNEFSEFNVANQLNNTTDLWEPFEWSDSDTVTNQLCHDLSDTTESSGVSTEKNAIKEKSSGPEELEFVTRGNKKAYKPSSEFPSDHINACGFLAEVLPATSVHDELWCSQEVRTLHDHFAGDSDSVSAASSCSVASSQTAFSILSSEKETVGVEHTSSSSSIAKESLGLSENPLDNALTRVISSGKPFDDTTKTTDMNTEENVEKEKSSQLELEVIVPGDKEPVEESNEIPSRDCEIACGFPAELSPVVAVHDVEFQCPQEVKIVCDRSPVDFNSANASSTTALSEIALPVAASGKELVEMELASSSSSIFKGSLSLPNNPIDNISTKLISCSNPCSSTALQSSTSSAHSDSSLVLLSSTSAPTVSCRIMAEEMGHMSSNSSMSLVSIGFLDDSAINNVTDSEMENVDLSDNVKLEESCVIVDDSSLHEVSRRTRRLRSYKKKIQDAFSSRKRLTKEYEQLAIWFGDLDAGSSQDTMQCILSSSTTVTLESDPQKNWTQDCEWELL